MAIHRVDLDGLAALGIETVRADMKLIHSIDVGFDRGYDNIGVGALAVYDTAILLQPDAHLTLRIRSCSDRID